MRRSRIRYVLLAVGVLGLGLASRRFAANPSFVHEYVGDALWALMVFFGVAFVAYRQPTTVVAALAVLFCFGIELSQLAHAPWLDSLRATRLGELVLGYSFLWSDLLCYSAGIAIGAVLDRWVSTPKQ